MIARWLPPKRRQYSAREMDCQLLAAANGEQIALDNRLEWPVLMIHYYFVTDVLFGVGSSQHRTKHR